MSIFRIVKSVLLLTIVGVGAAIWILVTIDSRREAEADLAAKEAGFDSAADHRKATAKGLTLAQWQDARAAEIKAEAERITKEIKEARAKKVPPPVLKQFTWSKGPLSVATVNFLAINDHPLAAVSDIVIRCDFSAPSKTLLSSQKATLFETIKPKESRRASLSFGFVHSQSSSASCWPVDYRVPPNYVADP